MLTIFSQSTTMKNLLSSLSSMYCLLLVAIYLVSTSTWLATADSRHYTEAEVSWLLLFLFLGSSLFLTYLLVFLRRPAHAHPGHNSHAPAFIRNGAFVFGLGTLLIYMLNFVEMLVQPAECNSTVSKVNTLLAVVFVGLSMIVVIFLPRLNLFLGWGGPHFGLMHVVATNAVAWIWHVLKESMHEYHEVKKRVAEERTKEEGKEILVELEEHPGGQACEEETPLGNFVRFLEPVLFAFAIEFVLIGATVFTNMWLSVGDERAEAQGNGKVVMVPHIRKTMQKMDWSNCLWGFLGGLLILLLNITSLAIFFGISSKDDSVDEYVAKGIHSITNILGIGALLYGLLSTQHLVDKHDPEGALMDRFLLKLSAFFVIVYTCFAITIGIFPSAGVQDVQGWLHIADGILNLVEAVLQVLFIELLLTKTIRTGERWHPGRQAVSLLIVMNLALWLVDTFELQKSRASVAEEHFYGPLTWVAVQRITLPVYIFFRFHSAVLLIDCWKGSYIPEDEEPRSIELVQNCYVNPI